MELDFLICKLLSFLHFGNNRLEPPRCGAVRELEVLLSCYWLVERQICAAITVEQQPGPRGWRRHSSGAAAFGLKTDSWAGGPSFRAVCERVGPLFAGLPLCSTRV